MLALPVLGYKVVLLALSNVRLNLNNKHLRRL
jgi:hypothetical protein